MCRVTLHMWGGQKCRPRPSEREKKAAESTRSSTGHEATDE